MTAKNTSPAPLPRKLIGKMQGVESLLAGRGKIILPSAVPFLQADKQDAFFMPVLSHTAFLEVE